MMSDAFRGSRRGESPGGGVGASPRRASRKARLAVEGLEDRRLLAGSPLAVSAWGGFVLPVAEGSRFSNYAVAQFVDPGGPGATSNYSADIDWGDGTRSSGTIVFTPAANLFTVQGSHTYDGEGTRPISVTIRHGSAPSSLVTSTATVRDAAKGFSAPPIAATAGIGYPGKVGSLIDSNPDSRIGEFSARITWGDGHTSTGVLVPASPPPGIVDSSPSPARWYDIIGANTYAAGGTYVVSVEVLEVGGDATRFSNSAKVSGPAGVAQGSSAAVQALYSKFLGRSASAGDLIAWEGALSVLGPIGVAKGIIRSREGLGRLVDELYVHYLGRPADAGGRAAFTQVLMQGGTEEQVISLLLGSQEYSSRATSSGTSANPDVNFVQSVYEDLLGRAAYADEVEFWLRAFATGGDRVSMAFIVQGLPEFRQQQIGSYYRDLLHRPYTPPASELAVWDRTRIDLLTLRTIFAGSPEFSGQG